MNIEESVQSETADLNIQVSDVENTDIITASYQEADKKLIDFVSKNIELMQSHLLSSKLVDLQSINNAYIDYMPVSIALNRLYQKVRLDAARAKEALDLFDDQAMDATKKKLNREDNKKTWYSAAELKAAAHTEYKSSYARLHAKYDLAEGRRSFIERLCKAWDSWQFGLGQLSRNLIAEANANGLDIKAQKVMPTDPDEARYESLVDQAMSNV